MAFSFSCLCPLSGLYCPKPRLFGFFSSSGYGHSLGTAGGMSSVRI